MHVKVLLAVSVEQGVVVVATKRRNRHLLIMLPALAFMLLGYQNCAMDMAPSTPGAASVACLPTVQQLSDFETIFNNSLNPTGTFPSGNMRCAGCHGDAVSPNGEGGYVIYQGITSSNPALVSRNYCASLNIGQTLVDHPMSASHGGGAYPQSDFQDLVTFARANF